MVFIYDIEVIIAKIPKVDWQMDKTYTSIILFWSFSSFFFPNSILYYILLGVTKIYNFVGELED